MLHHSIVFEQTHHASLTDTLTGLPNSRFMFMHLTRELTRADLLKSEVAFLVMDLDSFKDINALVWPPRRRPRAERSWKRIASVHSSERHLRSLCWRRVHHRAVGM